ncbi:MAG: hypothetical protein ACMXYK_05605 [Candidatus Woesearchaeota archaeon]
MKGLKLPKEEANRVFIEKEKALMETEVKYHVKSMVEVIDKMRSADPSFSDIVTKETIKFLLARQGNTEMYDELTNYIESLQDNFFEKFEFE